ncbi:MAG TPA: ATP-binding protein [Streptosporangiaceae bacterium]|nr:ATP-binding protein [Streptosporangiaceae bacterium]
MQSQAVLLASLTIPGEPAYLHAAREFVACTLGHGCTCSDTAVLLSSELVTNSVQHSNSRRRGGTITITVIAVPGGIRVEVIDEGSTTISAASLSQSQELDLAENGHGLRLVEILSARWSHYSDAAGTVTWFELTVPPCE